MGTEGRQELRDLPAVTVGLVYFVSIALVMDCYKWTYIFSHGVDISFFFFLKCVSFDSSQKIVDLFAGFKSVHSAEEFIYV